MIEVISYHIESSEVIHHSQQYRRQETAVEGKLGLGSGHISDAVSGGPSKIKLEIKIRGSHHY